MNSYRARLIPLLIFGLLIASARIRADSVAPLTLSDYRLPFIAVSLNGRETLALIDSGSFHGIEVSKRFADSLGLKIESGSAATAERHQGPAIKFHAAKVSQLVIGDYHEGDVDVEVAEGDIERISQQVGTKFEVILGWGFLRRFHVTIDFPGRSFRFGSAAGPGAAPIVQLDYQDDRRVPIVSGEINGHPTNLLFDTGAPMCNIDPSLVSEPVGSKLARPVILGGQTVDLQFRVKDMAVIKRTLDCPAVLGNNHLSNFMIRFNPDKHTIELSRPLEHAAERP